MKSLSPKKYIRNPEGLEEYLCGVCYQLPEEVYQCKGPCQIKFCLPCFSKVKANKDQCPMRCSAPFEINPCKTALISFICPFGAEKCEVELTSVGEFNRHYQQCKFISEEWQEWMYCRNHYRCDKGHQLLFLQEKTLTKMYGFGRAYSAANNHICAACGEQGLSRSICPDCSTLEHKVIYCGKCRVIPCTRLSCTYMHGITEREAYHHQMVCDFCGVSCKVRGNRAFSDTKCNFDICQLCYKGMGEEHLQVPALLEEDAVKHLFRQHVAPLHYPMHLWQMDSSDEELELILGEPNVEPQEESEGYSEHDSLADLGDVEVHDVAGHNEPEDEDEVEYPQVLEMQPQPQEGMDYDDYEENEQYEGQVMAEPEMPLDWEDEHDYEDYYDI